MERSQNTGEVRRTAVQFVKFAIVGALNTIVDFLVFQALNLLVGWTYLAQVIGYSCGIINSYAWNSNWTFRNMRTRSVREMGTFLLVNLVSLGAKIARDGDHHGLAGAIDIGAGGTHLKTALKPRLGDDTHESSSLLCNNLGRKQLCGNDAALVRAHNKRDAKIQNEV